MILLHCGVCKTASVGLLKVRKIRRRRVIQINWFVPWFSIQWHYRNDIVGIFCIFQSTILTNNVWVPNSFSANSFDIFEENYKIFRNEYVFGRSNASSVGKQSIFTNLQNSTNICDPVYRCKNNARCETLISCVFWYMIRTFPILFEVLDIIILFVRVGLKIWNNYRNEGMKMLSTVNTSSYSTCP